MIAEPTLEHYLYYLRRVEGDPIKTIQERQAIFEQELRSLLAHLERLSGQVITPWDWPQESDSRLISGRIFRTDWLDNPATGSSCFVEARTYHDMYWLQVGYYQRRDQAGPEIFASLRNVMWQPAAIDHLLGSSVYLGGIAAANLNEFAAGVLAAYTGDPPSDILRTRLANGKAALFGSPEHPHVTALFYADAQAEAGIGRKILNDSAPRLELYRHKADRQLTWCEQNLPLLAEQERSLRELLEEVKQEAVIDLELLQRLVRLYGVFSGNVGILTDRQVTIGVNLKNLNLVGRELGPLIEDHFLSAGQDELQRRQEQLTTDLTFAAKLQQQVETAINTFRVQLELDRLADLQAKPDDAFYPEPTGWPGAPPTTWDTVTLRQLIIAAFDDEELNILCYDYFRSVFEKFSGGMTKIQKVQLLIDHCDRHLYLNNLLGLIKEHNRKQYNYFASRLRK